MKTVLKSWLSEMPILILPFYFNLLWFVTFGLVLERVINSFDNNFAINFWLNNLGKNVYHYDQRIKTVLCKMFTWSVEGISVSVFSDLKADVNVNLPQIIFQSFNFWSGSQITFVLWHWNGGKLRGYYKLHAIEFLVILYKMIGLKL